MMKKEQLMEALENAMVALYDYKGMAQDDEEMLEMMERTKEAIHAMQVALVEED